MSWQSVWSRASRIGQDSEEWRHDLARAIGEATRTEYASVATCRQSDFLMLDFSTYPAGYTEVNDLGNRVFRNVGVSFDLPVMGRYVVRSCLITEWGDYWDPSMLARASGIQMPTGP